MQAWGARRASPGLDCAHGALGPWQRNVSPQGPPGMGQHWRPPPKMPSLPQPCSMLHLMGTLEDYQPEGPASAPHISQMGKQAQRGRGGGREGRA